ncbi:MAG: hypothetical protein AAF363_15105 [Bacteroidota bacterium]
MTALEQISESEAKRVIKKLGCDFHLFTVDEFKDAFNRELKAEIKEGELNPNQNLSKKALEDIGRISMCHINTFDD